MEQCDSKKDVSYTTQQGDRLSRRTMQVRKGTPYVQAQGLKTALAGMVPVRVTYLVGEDLGEDDVVEVVHHGVRQLVQQRIQHLYPTTTKGLVNQLRDINCCVVAA
jgi:hypothetical protein